MDIKVFIDVINKYIIVLKIAFIKKNQGIALIIKNVYYHMNTKENVIVVQKSICVKEIVV